MQISQCLAVVAVFGFAAASCRPDPVSAPLCTFPLHVRSTPSTEPRFDWDACEITVLFVTVANSSPMEFMWRVEAPDGAELRSGIVYGRVPEGALELIPPRSLVRGATYDVYVMHHPSGDRRVIGGGVFTF